MAFNRKINGDTVPRNIDPQVNTYLGSLNWCKELVHIKCLLESPIQKVVEQTKSTFPKFIHTMEIHDKKIAFIDQDAFKEFDQLRELSLTGNLLTDVAFLPVSLEFLCLNANKSTIY